MKKWIGQHAPALGTTWAVALYSCSTMQAGGTSPEYSTRAVAKRVDSDRQDRCNNGIEIYRGMRVDQSTTATGLAQVSSVDFSFRVGRVG